MELQQFAWFHSKALVVNPGVTADRAARAGSHLGLSVDVGPVVNQLCDHLLLPCQGCDVQGRVPFLLKHKTRGQTCIM